MEPELDIAAPHPTATPSLAQPASEKTRPLAQPGLMLPQTFLSAAAQLSGEIWISTRRLAARPASVELSAIGRLSPKPCV